MKQSVKIVIPMAGYGSRLRPHTWVRPKPLLPLAGKRVIDYALDQFKTLPGLEQAEYVFIVSANQGDQIQKYMQAAYPAKTVHFILQEEMRGQAHALWMAREHLRGPLLIAFSDTLIETDLSFLSHENADAVAWVKPMEDPRRFGVIELDEQGWATRMVEKPSDCSNNLVLVGFYYFRDGKGLMAAIEEQMRRGKSLKGEYFLTDAINVYLEQGIKMRKQEIAVWLDAGIPEAVLETNRYLLDHGLDGGNLPPAKAGVSVVPPVHIPAGVTLENVVIGPYVSLAKGCVLKNVIIRDSILDEGAVVTDSILEHSLIGRNTEINGKPVRFNIGDNSQVTR